MNGFGVVCGAHFKGVVVVDEPRFRFVSEGQQTHFHVKCQIKGFQGRALTAARK